MQIPKTRRSQKKREKRCLYPDCGKIFFGIHIAKYCEEHREDRYRIRKRATPEDVNKKNQTIKHEFTEVITQIMQCGLEECNVDFDVKIFPRQYIYPKYCPEHRNEYRRIRHLSLIGRDDLIEKMLTEGDKVNISEDAQNDDEHPLMDMSTDQNHDHDNHNHDNHDEVL